MILKLDFFIFNEGYIAFDDKEWDGEGSPVIWGFDHCTVYEDILGELLIDTDDMTVLLAITHVNNLSFSCDTLVMEVRI